MTDTQASGENEFRLDIGRADKGQMFVRVVHIPSGKERIVVGLQDADSREIAQRLTAELRTELGLQHSPASLTSYAG